MICVRYKCAAVLLQCVLDHIIKTPYASIYANVKYGWIWLILSLTLTSYLWLHPHFPMKTLCVTPGRPACKTSLAEAFKLSYHMARTTPGPWGGHRGNWDDERDPTSRTQAAVSLLLWRWSLVLQGVVEKRRYFWAKFANHFRDWLPVSLFIVMQFPPLHIYSMSWDTLLEISNKEYSESICLDLKNTLKREF